MKTSITNYIGHPYEDLDCFELVKSFYRMEFNIDLKHYWEGETHLDKKQAETLIISGVGNFEKVTEPIFGDIVVVRLYGYACHIGVRLTEGLMLHTLRGVGSCIEPIKKYERMVEGYYRHKETPVSAP